MKPMNILVAVDRRYLQPLRQMLSSLYTTSQRPVDVYLLHLHLQEKEIEGLRGFLQDRCQMQLHAIAVDPMLLTELPQTQQFPIEVYLRVLSSLFLPETLERVLWLDSDMIIRRPLDGFYNRDFRGKSLIACPDQWMEAFEPDFRERLGLESGAPYFNSGVLLMNLPRLRQVFSLERFRECVQEHAGRLRYPDQDVLNLLYAGDVCLADAALYNCQRYYTWRSSDYERCVVLQAYVLHYVGHRKPWHLQFYNRFLRGFYDEQTRKTGDKPGMVFHVCRALAYPAYALYHLIVPIKGEAL